MSVVSRNSLGQIVAHEVWAYGDSRLEAAINPKILSIRTIPNRKMTSNGKQATDL